MWIRAVLVLAASSVTLGDSGELFDVTTVYDVSNVCMPQGKDEVDTVFQSGGGGTGEACARDVTGRVHARTNARGLLLHDGKDKYITPKKLHLFNSTCNGILCGWDIKDWKLTITDNKSKKCNSNQHECQYSESYYDRGYSYRNGREESCLNKDNFCDGRSKCLDGSDEQYCDVETCEPNGFLCHSKEKCIPLKWKCDSYKDCSDGSDEADCQQFVSTETEGKVLVSPILALQDTRPFTLCLALVLHYELPSELELLHILAQDSSKTQHFLEAVRSSDKGGWQVVHVDVSFPLNISSPVNLVVKKVGADVVKLFQITGCSSDGEEVESLPPKPVYNVNLNELKQSLPVFDASVKRLVKVKATDKGTKRCFNGGLMTSAGCACPPGFAGLKCEVGCGQYKFGQDCEGWCSAHLQGCKGLLLCSPFHKCRCAPGYSGDQCNQTCGKGWYGNDCSQKCGSCATSDTCDIFTGRCSSCEHGYVPPLCQQEYTYYNSEPAASSTDYGKITVAFDPKNIAGLGTPKLYQIQYTDVLNDTSRSSYQNWHIYTSKVIPSEASGESSDNSNHISEEIEGLEHGRRYKVRVLLMDSSFNKYDGSHVKSAEVLTKCDIPEDFDYNVHFESGPNSLAFSWAYVISEHWCPVESYEISWKEGWQWLSKTTHNEYFTLIDIIPGTKVEFKVRAKTCNGFAPYSQSVVASTQYNGTSAIEDLQMVSALSSSVEVAWKAPLGSEVRNIIYKVTFKCVQQPACMPGCVNATEGALTQDQTSVTLSPLLPFAQYRVTITPEDGPETSFYVGTSEALPTEVPSPSAQEALRTNTSLTVFWEPVPVCSGFLLGYNYHLLKEAESLKVLDSGFTKLTNVSFRNLTVSTEYVVKVFVATIAGWNPQSFLTLKSSTSATVPEVVRNLTVYKRGRNTLGLRWAAPRASYGLLKAFTVSYSLGSKEASHVVEPTPCVPWPHLYCHTLQGLRPNGKYNISVSARNSEVAEDGESVTVTEITKESSPTVPEDLVVTNKSSTSVDLEWRYPDLANGIIRSFVVNVEETEKHDQDSCCQIYPLVELPVQEELQVYKTEVTGLHPASTYYVSVTAKTVGLGPSRALTVHTRPPHLPQSTLPSLNVLQGPVITAVQNLTWLPQETPSEVDNTEVYNPLVKTHLLLAVSNETASLDKSGILDPKLNSLLQANINKPFFFLGEYTQESVKTDSEWGEPPSSSPLNDGHSYQLAAVQVTEYNGVFNTDLCYSSRFTV